MKLVIKLYPSAINPKILTPSAIIAATFSLFIIDIPEISKTTNKINPGMSKISGCIILFFHLPYL